MLAVEENYRLLGIGTRLVAAVVEAMRCAECEQVRVLLSELKAH